MGNLNISEIQSGMALAEPVTNFQGVMLLPKGTVLSDRHLNLLKSWGITGANIEGIERDEKSKLAELNEWDRWAIEEKIKQKFPYEQLDPLNNELKRVAVNVMIKKHTGG